MIRNLRIRLIAAAMLSLFIVISLIIGAINIANYRAILQAADSVLDMMKENGGHLAPAEDMDINWRKAGPRLKSPELQFEMRYFSAVVSADGAVAAADTGRIAAVDGETVAEYVRRALKKSGERGLIEGYRFLRYAEGEYTRIIFLDCGRLLVGFMDVLVHSVTIALLGILTVFVLMVLMSRRIIRPISESYEKQKRFITDAGHEIKTPITIIDADVEIMEMETGPNEWLQDIRNQAARLSALTSDLIYLARMEESRKITLIDFPISDLAAETAASFQAPALTRKIHFSTEIQPMLSFRGDENNIRQLISILLDNAVKYSDENGYIGFRLEKQGRAICINVENSVDALPEGALENMFDRFYRGDPARSSQVNGYGIGLSIARAIVNAHRGKIAASAPDGKRLVISVTLPA